MAAPAFTLRNSTTALSLTGSYAITRFDQGSPALKADVAAALAAGQRVAESDWHDPCSRSMDIDCIGATAEASEALVNALVAVLHRHGTTLEVASDETLFTTIRAADVIPGEWTPATLSARAQGYIRVTVEMVTDPYWYGAEVAVDAIELTAIPAEFSVDSVPGEVPALVRMKVLCDDDLPAGGFLALGLRSSPGASYDTIDDYSGAVDANAYGGEESAVSPNLTATMQAVATAPNIDTGDNTGRFACFARVENTATAHTTVGFRVASAVTGSSLAATTTVYGDTVDATLDNGEGFEVVPLGEVNIPAGAVPDVATGSGWSTPAVTISQTTEDADTAAYSAGQTFALTAGEKVTSITLKTGTLPTARYSTWELFATVGGVPTGRSLTSGIALLSAANTEATANFDFIAPTTGVYAVRAAAGSGATWRKNTAGGYADGDELSAANTIVTGDDLWFKVTTQTQLGFNSTVTLQATDTAAASKVAQVDYLVRVPTDEGYICINRDFAATQGVMVDEAAPQAHKHNIYLADPDGIGPSVLAQATEWRGSLMPRPGDNTYTIVAYTPAGAAPGGGDVYVWYRPRYLTCGS